MLHAVSKTPPKALLVACAENAFAGIAGQSLNWLARWVHADCQPADSLFAKLAALVRAIIPDISDERLLEILALRMQRRELLDALVQVDDIGCLVHSADRRDFEKEVEEAGKDRDAADVFEREWHAQRSDLRHRAGKKHVALKNAAGRKYPGAYPLGPLTRDQASQLLPLGWRLSMGKVNGRWQVYRAGKALSRSWHLHGHEEACRQALACAWSDWLLMQGMEQGDCPIRGLLPHKGAAPSGAASSTD